MIEVALLVSLVSVAFSVFSGVVAMKRTSNKDSAENATQLTTVLIKLENISGGISEIKNELRNVKEDIQDLRDRMIIVEQSTKSAHRRLDEVTGQKIRTPDKQGDSR